MLRWLKTVVVSDVEKAQVMRQVGIGKTSVSESLLTCRKSELASKPGRSKRSRDESGGCPVYWPGGVRHEGGVSPVCGSCTERGKARFDTAWRSASVWRWGREGAPVRRKPEV